MNETEITISLGKTEIQYIVEVLSQRPYREVAELLPKLVAQANDSAASQTGD